MRDQIDEALSGILGRSTGNYTLEEIKAAEQRKKKYGGTLLDNLRAVTGRSLPTMTAIERQNDDIMKMCEERGIDINAGGLGSAIADLSAGAAAAEKAAEGVRLSSGLSREAMDEFARNMELDYGEGSKIDQAAKEARANAPIPTEVDAATFNGVADLIAESAFGQDAFIKKLLIAFKRPFVMPPAEGKARNSIFITGDDNTGRHFILKKMTKALADKRILRSDEIVTLDLSLYPTATEEKLFLQDLYQALSGGAQVIVFENYEACHKAYLSSVSELVLTGSCKLSARYVMQNGQLISVTNALAGNAVGSLSAKDKYLVFMSTKKLEKLADCFGAPFVNALGDTCVTAKLEAEALKKIAEREQAELIERSAKQLKFKVSCSEDFCDYAVTKSARGVGLAGILDFYEDCLKALAQLRLEGDYANDAEVCLSAGEAVIARIDEQDINLLGTLPTDYTGEIDAVKAELDSIVGLKEIKEYILSLEEYYRTQQRRREEGLKTSEVSKHMIFTGSPGTGKTTIARIISRYLKAIGVLSGGQLIEVSRADLVGRYVGHTAPLTNQVIGSAIGGVLFIDEAYSLYRGNDDSFGLEAIDTLVKGIEDNRDNLIVILAGYSTEMQEFLTSNSGLKSRFPNIINFPDYSGEELLAIAKINAKSKGYRIDEGADPALQAYFSAVQALRASDAGNGRLARNKIEQAILNHSRRMVAEPDADLSLLTSQDFELDDIGE